MPAWDETRARSGGYLHPKKVQRLLALHGHICHLCGHGGAEELDHIVPWAEWTHPTLSVHDATNLAPAHGSACMVCGVECHAVKTKAEAARGRARGHARMQARLKYPKGKHPGLL